MTKGDLPGVYAPRGPIRFIRGLAREYLPFLRELIVAILALFLSCTIKLGIDSWLLVTAPLYLLAAVSAYLAMAHRRDRKAGHVKAIAQGPKVNSVAASVFCLVIATHDAEGRAFWVIYVACLAQIVLFGAFYLISEDARARVFRFQPADFSATFSILLISATVAIRWSSGGFMSLADFSTERGLLVAAGLFVMVTVFSAVGVIRPFELLALAFGRRPEERSDG